jgi:hypothetical protein
MTFIDDFKTVLAKSWAVRMALLSAALDALAHFQDQLPMIQGLVPKEWYAAASIACALAVPLARVLHQEGISGPKQ